MCEQAGIYLNSSEYSINGYVTNTVWKEFRGGPFKQNIPKIVLMNTQGFIENEGGTRNGNIKGFSKI